MRVKNNTGSSDTWCGQTIASAAEYDIQAIELATWRSSDHVVADLSSGDLLIGDGVTFKAAGSGAIAYLLGTANEVLVLSNPAFSAKTVGAKKLNSRATGAKHTVVVGANTLDFVVPYNEVKFNGLQICNGKVGESVNLKVLDTPTGTISGVPDYQLNQFGYSVNVPDGFYQRESAYDADLIKDLKIRMEYTATEARDLYVNYLIHELKT